MFKPQHALKRKLAIEYNPENILTAGMVAEYQLLGSPGLEWIAIDLMGSNKNSVHGNPDALVPDDVKVRNACLVIPDGNSSEYLRLFGISIECAKELPDVKFIWRLHPILSFDSLLSSYPELRSRPSNVILSTESLSTDIAQSSWALYCGTTEIVQAVSAGLRPIYSNIPDELSTVPLYELDYWRKYAATSEELRALIELDQLEGQAKTSTESRDAAVYADNFYTPLNPESLLNILEA